VICDSGHLQISAFVSFFLVLFLSFSSQGLANETSSVSNLSLEELANVEVSTVSRVSETVNNAPGSVYSFSRQVIMKRGYRSLGDLLRVVPGFTVFHKDLQYVAGVRGLNANDNEKITLLINGEETNQVNEPDFLNGPINLDNVDRVEVVVGPSSFFQQANTLAATINVITQDTEGGEGLFATGNQLPYSTTVMAGKRWASDRFVNFSFTTEKVNGFDAWNADFRPNLQGRDLTGELDWPNYFAVLKGQLREWTGQLVAYRSSIPELLIDNGSQQNNGQLADQFYTVFAKNEHPWSEAVKSIFRSNITLKEQSRLNQDGPPMNGLQQSIKQVAYNGELGVEYTLKGHFIQAGIQGTYNFNFGAWYTLNQESPPLTIPQTTLIDKNNFGIGFYVDDVFDVSDVVRLIGGVRVDQNSELSGNRWYPGARAAVILQPVQNWFSKLIYNRAVRMPSVLAAMNIAWGSNNPGAPEFANFSPTAQSPEILSTFEFHNIVYLGSTRLEAALYHQYLSNFISWLSPHTNVGNFHGSGVEFNTETPLSRTVNLWANFSFNNSVLDARIPAVEDISEEQHHVEVNRDGRIIGAPKYTANLGTDLEIFKDLVLSPQLRYFTDQAAYSFSTQSFETIYNRYYLDAALTWKNRTFIRDTTTDLRLSIQNLFNNRDQVAGQWLRDTYMPRGISAFLTADIRF
jgi:outer membrane receptor for ferrienterochelin and colicin